MRFLSVSTISNFIKELQTLDVITSDDYGYWYIEHYDIISFFVENWILDKNKAISDYYLGDNHPDEFNNYNEVYVYIRDSVEKQITRYVNKCVEKCEELGDYALEF